MVAFCHLWGVVMSWGRMSFAAGARGQRDASDSGSGVVSASRWFLVNLAQSRNRHRELRQLTEKTFFRFRVDKNQPMVLTVFQRHGSHAPDGVKRRRSAGYFFNLAPRGTKTTTRRGQSRKPGQDRSRTHGGTDPIGGKTSVDRYLPRRSDSSSEVGAHVASSESREGALP